jgi:uncharacterized protein (TIGR02147 family)
MSNEAVTKRCNFAARDGDKVMSNKILEFLKTELEEKKKRNPKFSLRALAKQLNMHSATLSQILNSKRSLSFKIASQILTALDVEDYKKNALLLTLEDENAYHEAPTEYVELSPDQITAMAGWQFYAILCALELPLKSFDPTEIGRVIGCDLERIKSSLDELERFGFISVEDGRIIPFKGKLTAPPGLPVAARKRAHLEYLEKANEALVRSKEMADCDFSGVTLSTSKDKLPEASRRIREFRRSLARFLGEGDKKDAVYRINIQYFPLE